MPEIAVLPQTHLIRFARNETIQRSTHPWRRLSLKFGILVCDRNSNVVAQNDHNIGQNESENFSGSEETVY